eukprot:4780742-Pyramimonas_sp.AAC.1
MTVLSRLGAAMAWAMACLPVRRRSGRFGVAKVSLRCMPLPGLGTTMGFCSSSSGIVMGPLAFKQLSQLHNSLMIIGSSLSESPISSKFGNMSFTPAAVTAVAADEATLGAAGASSCVAASTGAGSAGMTIWFARFLMESSLDISMSPFFIRCKFRIMMRNRSAASAQTLGSWGTPQSKILWRALAAINAARRSAWLG